MATKVLVPLLGEGVEEVTVTKWLKREGESINELEPLLEVNTDKVDTEIPAPASGTVIQILAQEGVVARVGTVLAFIGKPGESVEAAAEPAAPAASTPSPVLVPQSQGAAAAASGSAAHGQHSTREVGFISPVVARMAAENGIDLARVRGTGLNGRITKADVSEFIQSNPAPAVPTRGTAGPPGAGDELIPHSTIRRQIAERMLHSKAASPHVLTVMEADLGRVAAHREANKLAFERDGVRLTFTAYFIAAIVAGLKANPLANVSWSDAGVVVHRSINVGMATSLGADGLIVPVIKDADNLSFLSIARAVNDLADRARARRLQPDEVRGGTFTLTNHGIAGSLFAMPIINQPQSAILGTGAIQKRVVAVTDAAGNDALAVRPMVYLSLVFDHRVLDGVGADGFLMAVKKALETWAQHE